MHGCIHAFFGRILWRGVYDCIDKQDRSLKWLKMALCKYCEKPFEQTRDWQKFCSKACRKAYHRKYPNMEKRIDDLERRVSEIEKKMDK